MGKVVDSLLYFILVFREGAAEGAGLDRARCELGRVEPLLPTPPGARVPAIFTVPGRRREPGVRCTLQREHCS